MIGVAFYDATGAIQQVMIVPDDAGTLQAAPAGLSMATISPSPNNLKDFLNNNFVNAGTITARATMAPMLSATTIAADGTAVATITGLADPCTITVAGVLAAGPETVTGGTIAITSDQPGTITIAAAAAPAWFPWSGTLTAV